MITRDLECPWLRLRTLTETLIILDITKIGPHCELVWA